MELPPPPKRKLGVGAKATVLMIDRFSRITQGYSVPFLEEMIFHYGSNNMIRFALAGLNMFKQFGRQLGEGQGQILLGFSALLTGCEYCSVGHTYAGSMFYFKATGRLLPYSERDMFELMRMDDDAIRRFVEEKVVGDDVAQMRPRLLRIWELRTRTEGTPLPDDQMLQDITDIWTFMNECSVLHSAPDYPTCRLVKDKKLLADYNAARDAFEKGEWKNPDGPANTSW